MKKLLLISLVLFLSTTVWAQYPKWVGGYVASWDLNMSGVAGGGGASNYGNMPYTAIPYTDFTDLYLFAMGVDSTGKIVPYVAWDGSTGWSETLLQQRMTPWITYARANGAKRIVMTVFGTGNGGSWTTMTNNAAYRTQAVTTLLDSCIRNNAGSKKVDGFDFDIEPYLSGDTTGMKLFITELYDSLQNYHQWYDTTKKPLIIACPVGSGSIVHSWATMQQYFDELNYQAYNMFGTWTTKTWLNAPVFTAGATDTSGNPLSSVSSFITTMVNAGVSKSKIGIICNDEAVIWTGGAQKSTPTRGLNNILQAWSPSHIPSTNGVFITYYTFKMNYEQRYPDSIIYSNIYKASFMHLEGSTVATDTILVMPDTNNIYAVVKFGDSLGVAGIGLWNITNGYLGATNYPSVTQRNPFPQAITDAIQSSLTDTVLSIVSGNGQSATVSTQITNPLVIQLVDNSGTPIVGYSVTFAIASYPGGTTGQSLTTTTTTTDGSGQASTKLTVGNLTGTYTVTCSSNVLVGSPVTFTITGTAVPAPITTRYLFRYH